MRRHAGVSMPLAVVARGRPARSPSRDGGRAAPRTGSTHYPSA